MTDTGDTTGKSEGVTAPPTVSSRERDLIKRQLSQLSESLTPQDQEATLSTLKRIFDNVIQHPNDDKYRQIKLTGKTFAGTVWQYPAGKELIKMSGWVVEGDHVRLTNDSHVQAVSELLRDATSSSLSAYTFSTILGKRPREPGDQSTNADSGSSSQCCTLSGEPGLRILDAIGQGNGKLMKNLLKPYHTACVKNMQFESLSIVNYMFMVRQIGIARILVNVYGVDANSCDEDGCPYFTRLFDGCDSTEAGQSLIIQFIKELKIDVSKQIHMYTALHLAVMNKLFSVTKFLVEEGKVDVNCVSNAFNGGTPLHMACAIGDTNTAQYLVEHGADQEAMDNDGRKPNDYNLYAGSSNLYACISNSLIKRRPIFKNIFSLEYYHFKQLCIQGLPEVEAVDATYEKFPSLQDIDSNSVNQRILDATPTLNGLNHYITDMAPSYYQIGLVLDIVNSKLKVIKSDPSLPDIEGKCLKMLEAWLESDTSATWKKLCDALDEVGLSVLAEQMKLQ